MQINLPVTLIEAIQELLNLAKGRHVLAAAFRKATVASITLQLNAKAIADFKKVAGRVAILHPGANVTGYLQGHEDTRDMILDTRAVVRFASQMDDDSILHWNDDWLDPYWDLEPMEAHPQLGRMRSMWLHGPSYSTVIGAEEQLLQHVTMVTDIPLIDPQPKETDVGEAATETEDGEADHASDSR